MGNRICGQQCSCNDIQINEVYQAVKSSPMETTDPLKKSLSTKPKVNSLSRQQIPIVCPQILEVIETRNNFYFPFQENNFPKRKFENEVYQGQLNNLGQPHGLGRMFKQDGSLFVGYFVEGKAEGEGIFIFKNGSYFEGKLHNNMADCVKGKYFSKDLKYEGGFKGNTFDGEGKEEGLQHTFEGTYLDGKRIYGDLKWWKQGKPEEKYGFYGKFDQNGQFTDQGVLQQPTGKYTGNFSKGKKHGFGVYQYQSQLKYEGEYVRGEKEGKGKIYFSSSGGLIYDGGWKSNMPDGEGYKYNEQGKKIGVFYKDGINILNLRSDNFVK